MSSRKVVLAHDGIYYHRAETSEVGGKICPRPGAIPLDSFGRTLDEPTIDDADMSQVPVSSGRPASFFRL